MRIPKSEEKTGILLRQKTLLNVSAAILTTIISGVILYQILLVGDMLEEEGLLGIFLVSLFSHLTVVGRDLFTPAFVALIGHYHPALLGFSAGLGGAIGEVTAYYWGLGIREAFRDEGEKSATYKWIEKYGLLMILVVAASPLPDVPIALLAGSARFSLKKFLLVEVVGKSAYYSVGASVGGYIFQLLIGTVDRWMLSLIVVLASILLCVAISWSKSREKIIQIFRRLLRGMSGETFKGDKKEIRLLLP